MYAPYFKLYFTKNIYYTRLIRCKHLILDYFTKKLDHSTKSYYYFMIKGLTYIFSFMYDV